MIYVGKTWYLFCSLNFNCKHVLNFAAMNFSDFKCEIPELNIENYKVWKERILLYLGLMDINYAIRKNESPSIT